MIVGFVASAGAADPRLPDQRSTGDTHGYPTGKEGMQSFINALLPFARFDDSSTATVSITFDNGRISALSIEAWGVCRNNSTGAVVPLNANGTVPAGATRERLILRLENVAGVGLSAVSSIGAASFEVVATPESIDTVALPTVEVVYANGFRRAERPVWDLSTVHEVAESNAGQNIYMTINGKVAFDRNVTARVYIVDGAYTLENYSSTTSVYNANWREPFPGERNLSFNYVGLGGLAGGTYNESHEVSWNYGAVPGIAALPLGGATYGVTASYNGFTTKGSSMTFTGSGSELTVTSVAYDAKVQYASNSRVNHANNVEVTFNDGNTYLYPVAWSNPINMSYGKVRERERYTSRAARFTVRAAILVSAIASWDVGAKYVNVTFVNTYVNVRTSANTNVNAHAIV